MTEKSRPKIAALGGIDAIIRAMSVDKDYPELQENACCALVNFAFIDGMFCLCTSITRECVMLSCEHQHDITSHMNMIISL